MPRIIILCPRLKVAVPTGFTTEMVKLDSIVEQMKVTLQCPACGSIHKWTRKDAWTEKQTKRRTS
jgi:hypothetical protein